MTTQRRLCLTAAAAALVAASAAKGDLLDFTVFENSQSAPTQGLQLTLQLITAGSTVDFIFRNESSVPAVVRSIYIESTPLSSGLIQNGFIAGQSPGVVFGTVVAPPTPPGSVSGVGIGGPWGGNLFALAASSPSPHNGLGPGDSVTVRFDLGGSYQALVQSLTADPTAFRMVQHVQALDGDASVWTVNRPIPAPGVGLLALAGALVAARRRRAM